MAKLKKPKKRNPQDATLRNVRAAQRAIKVLEGQVEGLRRDVDGLVARLNPPAIGAGTIGTGA